MHGAFLILQTIRTALIKINQNQQQFFYNVVKYILKTPQQFDLPKKSWDRNVRRNVFNLKKIFPLKVIARPQNKN